VSATPDFLQVRKESEIIINSVIKERAVPLPVITNTFVPQRNDVSLKNPSIYEVHPPQGPSGARRVREMEMF